MPLLPRWDLRDLYPAADAPELLADQQTLTRDVAQFARELRGSVATLEADALAAAIRRYEDLEERLGKLTSYGDLLFSTHSTDAQVAGAYQNLQEFASRCEGDLLFFTLELSAMDAERLQAQLAASEALRTYQPWLRDVRAFTPYQLEERLERLLLDQHTVASHAWVRLYEDLCNRITIRLDDATLTLPQALECLSHHDRDRRQRAALALGEAFDSQRDRFAMILSTLIKAKAIEDDWRGFARPVSSRNIANLVEDTVVDTLVETVWQTVPELSHRYYRVKARLLGLERLEYWDRSAPLPGTPPQTVPFAKAQEMVLAAYRAFSPEMARLGQRFFDEHWIDAPVEAGKTSGAFSHPTVPAAHPYILLNYQGTLRDVMTLAHELGHGIHQLLAAPQGALMAETPLTLAETASVFGEQLTFQYLLSQTSDAEQRRHLIAAKIEDMLGTVVRQIGFYQFETRLHAARREGELSAETIRDHWLEVQSATFGPAVALDPSYHAYWTYISHFFHTPFYVYAYAFGDCLVHALYHAYEEACYAGNAEDFTARYLAMLRAGGSKRHQELLAPFDLDITRQDFWQRGLGVIAQMIDQLEA